MLKVCGILFCVLLKETYGAQAVVEPVSKPPHLADQEGCYDPDLKIVLGYEKSFNTTDCTRHLCNKGGDIVILTCPAVEVAEGAVLVKGNQTLPYPECCDHPELTSKSP